VLEGPNSAIRDALRMCAVVGKARVAVDREYIGRIMEDALYQVVAALVSAMLIAIVWYFWNDPDRWRRFNKDFKDALDRFNGGPPASA